ncbi:MAG: 2-oxo acid dehydrogenase subunit E2 [Planctomycetaceae bacterium]|nr:2-oxo acid dehydrogenase subunit E2 [Planctomycetaceae bacterium]
MEQGTFVGWLKKNGDNVQPGEPLFTLEGEKAIQEIEAVDAGTLHFDATNPAEGNIVAVGAVIGYLLAVGETAPHIPPRLTPATPAPQSESVPRPSGSGQLRSPHDVGQVSNLPVSHSHRQVENLPHVAPPASPAVRRLARQLGVDLAPLTSAGRISEADVCRRYLQSRGELLPSVIESKPVTPLASAIRSSTVPRRSRNLPTISPRAARSAARLGVDWTQLPGTGSQGRIRERDVLAVADNIVAPPLTTSAATRTIPITPLRRAIANRMVTSLQQTAPVTLTTQIDVSSLVEFRDRLKQSGESLIPSLTDCFVKLTALALCEHPTLNARWRDDAIKLIGEIHIGIAVDTDAGLLVPVVRDAQRQTVFEIASQSRTLIEQARARRLTAQDLQGGTFTITNLGSLEIDAFTPIINFPETAILGLGRIRAQPIASTADSARPRHHMTLSLTFDHRVLDGAPAARFLQTLSRLTAADSQSLFEPTSHR